MTRGSGYCITDTDLLQTDEFNGDMYKSGNGKSFFYVLKGVKDWEDFKKKMSNWNKRHHNYSDFETYKTPFAEIYPHIQIHPEKKQVQIRFDVDYFGFWFSDYTYVKNLSSKDVLIVDRDGTKRVIKPNETMVSNYGHYPVKW